MLTQIINDIKNKFKEPEKTNYVGFCFGFTYGAGIAYKKVMGNQGFQVAFLPFRWQREQEETKPDGTKQVNKYINSLYAGGATFFNTLNNGKYGSLYFSTGLAAARKSDSYPNYISKNPEDPNNKDFEIKQQTNTFGGIGLGPAIGIQAVVFENFVLSLEVPISFVFTFLNDNIKDAKLTSILPIPNISILYRF